MKRLKLKKYTKSAYPPPGGLIYTLNSGSFSETVPVDLQLDAEVYAGEIEQLPCPHCHTLVNKHQTPWWDGSISYYWYCTCPRVIITYNEGEECCATEVCLDCILEAAKELPSV
jgi:hypothetical protein